MSRARILADYVSSGDELADKLSLSGGAMTGAITTNSTFDGVDVATRDAVHAPKANPTFTGTVQIPNISNLESAVAANTDKTGITSGQTSAISANTSKTGITSGQASAISANTSKTGITSSQASAISANTSKVTNSTDASDLTSGTLPIARIADDAVTADKLANSINTDIATGVTANTTANAALAKAGDTMTGDLILGDNVKLEIGSASGGDLQIYHDGTDSYIHDTGTGNLQLRTNGSEISILGNDGSEYMSRFIQDGAAELYHNGVKKFETTATGVTTTGINTSASLVLTPGSAPATTEGAMYYDSTSDSVKIRNASEWKQIRFHDGGAIATGGIITNYYDGNTSYIVHTFITSGVFTPTSTFNVDYLIVGGGGGGGHSREGHAAGGGGAGGFRTDTGLAVTAQAYTVVVGGGGGGGQSSTATGTDGSLSTFSTFTSAGGGGGGAGGNSGAYSNGRSGGSGGGGGSRDSVISSGGSGDTPSTTPLQGYDGHDSVAAGSGRAGSGGGAGGAGSGSTPSASYSAAGGIGVNNAYRTGSNVMYAAGGATVSTSVGAANTGNGGGGGYTSTSYVGSGGGSGIVIIRYAI